MVNILGAAVSSIIYIGVWRHHNIKLQRKDDLETRIEQLSQGIHRIRRDWESITPVPSQLNTNSSVLDHDLNLFGYGSIGQLLFNMSTLIGDLQLAEWLNKPSKTKDIQQR